MREGLALSSALLLLLLLLDVMGMKLVVEVINTKIKRQRGHLLVLVEEAAAYNRRGVRGRMRLLRLVLLMMVVGHPKRAGRDRHRSLALQDGTAIMVKAVRRTRRRGWVVKDRAMGDGASEENITTAGTTVVGSRRGGRGK